MPYSHLTPEERIVIELFARKGLTSREIARQLDRHHITISRELRRNSSKSGYRAQTAERRAQTETKDAAAFRCLSRPELIAYVDKKLRRLVS